MQDQLIKVDHYRRENPSTGWNLKINFKFQKTPFIPKIKTLDKNISIYNNNFKKLKNHVEIVHNLLIKIRKLSDKK